MQIQMHIFQWFIEQLVFFSRLIFNCIFNWEQRKKKHKHTLTVWLNKYLGNLLQQIFFAMHFHKCSYKNWFYIPFLFYFKFFNYSKQIQTNKNRFHVVWSLFDSRIERQAFFCISNFRVQFDRQRKKTVPTFICILVEKKCPEWQKWIFPENSSNYMQSN